MATAAAATFAAVAVVTIASQDGGGGGVLALAPREGEVVEKSYSSSATTPSFPYPRPTWSSQAVAGKVVEWSLLAAAADGSTVTVKTKFTKTVTTTRMMMIQEKLPPPED